MSDLSRQLKLTRLRCGDPGLGKPSLTQERFGELVALELGLATPISFQTVSRWENGHPPDSAGDRRLHLSLLKVYIAAGGIQTVADANTLLAAGNLAPLGGLELSELFPGIVPATNGVFHPPTNGGESSAGATRSPEGARPDFIQQLWQAWLDRHGAGAPPDWPKALLATLRDLEPRRDNVWKILVWLGIIWAAQQSLYPLMHWPFVDDQGLEWAMTTFALGSFLVPGLIAWLAAPWTSAIWLERPTASRGWIGFYGWLGATIGYQTMCLGLFGLALVGYHFGVPRLGPLAEAAALGAPLIFSYATAKRLASDLWRAYERLDLAVGGVFVVCTLLGPGWAWFFGSQQAELLAFGQGALMLWLSIAGFLALTGRAKRRTGSIAFPAHWWIAIFGVGLVAQSIRLGTPWTSMVYLVGVLVTDFVLAAWGRLGLSLKGGIWCLAGLAVLTLCSSWNQVFGWVMATALLALWGWRGRAIIRLPIGWWLQLAAVALSLWLQTRVNMAWELGLSLYGGLTVAVLLFERWWSQGRSGS